MVATVAAAAAVTSTALSIRGAREARKQGDKSAEQERLATEERIRRLGLQREAILGAQIAGAASGGVDVRSASVRSLQAETIAEFDRQISFTRTAGAFAAESAELRGRAAAYRSLSTGISSLTNAIRIIDKDILGGSSG